MLLPEIDPYDNKEILTRLAGGDEYAFRAIFEQYHHALFRNVMRLLRAEEEARDVVQEVFITLWEKRTELSTDKNIGGWLFTLSYHRAVNYLKMNLRRELREQEADRMSTDADNSDLLEQQQILLEAALNTLSPQKRKVFELCKLQGKTYEAAARELNISRHTVNEYLKQAMAGIRDYIREQPSQQILITALALEIFF